MSKFCPNFVKRVNGHRFKSYYPTYVFVNNLLKFNIHVHIQNPHKGTFHASRGGGVGPFTHSLCLNPSYRIFDCIIILERGVTR